MGNKQQQQQQIVTFVTYNMNEKNFPSFNDLFPSSYFFSYLFTFKLKQKHCMCLTFMHTTTHKRKSLRFTNYMRCENVLVPIFCFVLCYNNSMICCLTYSHMTSPQIHDWMTQKCIIITSLLSTILYS